jgi:hypothetical protein
MALGFGKKKSDNSSSPISSPSANNADIELTKDGLYSGDTAAAERGGKKPRKMNRIDGPITKPIGAENVLNDDGTDSDISIGKQMEMEAGNAIKYRTCSWQKVRYSFPSRCIRNGIVTRSCDRFSCGSCHVTVGKGRTRFIAKVAITAQAFRTEVLY